MNLTSAIIGDSSVLGHKQHKVLNFCLLPIATILPLTLTPYQALGSLQTLASQAYLGTLSIPRYSSGTSPLSLANIPAVSWINFLQVSLGYRNLLFFPFLFLYPPSLLTQLCLQQFIVDKELSHRFHALLGRTTSHHLLLFLLYRAEKAEAGEVTCSKLGSALGIDLTLFYCCPEFPQLHLGATQLQGGAHPPSEDYGLSDFICSWCFENLWAWRT